MLTIKDFQTIIWTHYIEIENEFLNCTRYVSLDEDNYKTFSEKFFSLYQIIGSEVDVIAKELCFLLGETKELNNIHQYCKSIKTSLLNFCSEEVWVKNLDKILVPWKDWTYSINVDKNGVSKTTGTTPKWWTLYNKTKHARTQTLSSYGKPFYKFANLENVLTALSGLFVLNLYVYRELSKTLSDVDCFKYAIPESKLLILDSINKTHSAQIIQDYNFDGVTINFL